MAPPRDSRRIVATSAFQVGITGGGPGHDHRDEVAEPVPQSRAPVDNRALVLALFAALADDDLARLDDLVADDFVDHGAPPGAAPGPAGYRAVLSTLREALDLRWEVLGMVGEGERVMVHVRQRGRHVGEFLGVPLGVVPAPALAG